MSFNNVIQLMSDSLRGRRAESIRERIVDAVSSTAIETGSWEDPAICNYCANRLTKD